MKSNLHSSFFFHVMQSGDESSIYAINPTCFLTLFITPNFLLPQFLAIHIRLHLCTHQERATQFPIERVRLLRRRGETVFEHDGDEGADGIGDGLFGEWVWAMV